VTTTAHTPPTNPRFAYFDSLRALAVIAILAHHIAYYVGAQYGAWYSDFCARLGVGVTLFFLISGFLLYRPYAVSMLGGPPPLSVGVYARRRALRILPAYWLALTLLAVWPGLEGVFGSEWWALYGLLQSFSLKWIFKGITPAWSLSVEAAFYVMLPLFALALARAGRGLGRERRLRLQLVTLACFGAFGLGYRAFTFHQHSLVLLGTTLPAFLLWFSVGMSVAVLSAGYEGREREWGPTRWIARNSGWCWTLALGVLVGMSLSKVFPRPFSTEPDTMATHLGEHVLYALVALLVMLPAVFDEREGGLPRRLMGSRALRWLGTISYGLFLWHAPLLSAFQVRGWSRLIPGFPFLSLTLFGVPLVIACAWVSWRLVEQPLLRLAHARRSGQRSAEEPK
jgi:peptidoglycan/LPS O-acetylase OafA/YrhL